MNPRDGEWRAHDPVTGECFWESVGVYGVWTKCGGKWGIRPCTPEERVIAERVIPAYLLERGDKRAAQIHRDSIDYWNGPRV